MIPVDNRLLQELDELREIVRLLACCRVNSDGYGRLIDVPDDVNRWILILRARKAAGVPHDNTYAALEDWPNGE